MKSKRTAAVIGCGKFCEGKEGWAIGHNHAEGYQLADPELVLLGVDVNAENLAAFGRRFGLPDENLFSSTEALYSSRTPDFVSICTWPALHARQVIEAAGRGVKGILCEKPMALNGCEIDTMMEACQHHGALLAVAHQRCYNSNFRMARQCLRDGILGTDWVLEARVGGGWDMLSWTVHWFDLANWLFDASPDSILTGLDHTAERRYGHAVENASIVFADYPLRRQAIFITGPDSHQENLGALFLRGSTGFMRISHDVEVWTEADGYQRLSPNDAGPANFHALILDMFSALENGHLMECRAERTSLATRMGFAAHESARTQRKIAAPFRTGFAPLEILHHPPQPALPPGRIVLFADSHFGSGGPEGISEALQPHGEILLLDAEKGLTSNALHEAGTLLLYHTREVPDEETRIALTLWIASGKPTIFIHAALGGYRHWPEYQRWAGRTWIWDGPDASAHPHMECQLRATTPDFTAWTTAWLPQDEVFIKLGATAEIELLVEANIPSGTYPAAWRNCKFPNITAWVPGHRKEMWSIPAMRSGLLNMIQLASRTGKITGKK